MRQPKFTATFISVCVLAAAFASTAAPTLPIAQTVAANGAAPVVA